MTQRAHVHLLDANVLIDANRDYYPIDRVPEYWEWLEFQCLMGHVKLPVEIYEEVKGGSDAVASWVKDRTRRSSLLLDAEPDPNLVQRVVAAGYSSDLTETELIKVGRDPILVSYALARPGAFCIVTTETSKPSKQRANRKIPDVARDVGVRTCSPFEFMRELDFRTSWTRPT
ncbi:DUF4411 family protein [Gaopeijia maritima]|uniref:DUF4411 family protein n=1 Tax=Gaopeijia maritima TaxID=3119007 RepID=UPI003270271B